MGPESSDHCSSNENGGGRSEEDGTHKEQMIGSLGNALAGMNLNQNNGSFGYDGGSDAGSAALGLSAGQYTNGGGASAGANANDGSTLGAWGTSSLSTQGAGFPGANSMPGIGSNPAVNQNGEMPASSALLTSSGTTTSSSESELRESDAKNLFQTSEPTTPLRKESLELFLSQSPSKTLGGDLLKLNGAGTEKQQTNMPRSGSAYSLDELGRAPGSISSKFSTSGMTASSSGELRDAMGRRKSDSPNSCSVTGTSASSRSASPYLSVHETESYRSIQAFPGTEISASSSRSFANQATAEVNRMNSMSRGYSAENLDFRQNNMMQTNSLDYGYGQGMEPMQHGGRHGQQQPVAASNAPQVLYMAVPTPDGRGQMLQPVQMVQLQGQPSSYVLPPGGAGAAQPMMVLPTQTANDVATSNGGSNWQGQYVQSGIRETGYGQYSGRSSADDYVPRRNSRSKLIPSSK